MWKWPPILVMAVALVPAFAADAIWQSVRNGDAVVIMRHALAPGTGDPENFEIGDCSTQRNLSDEGRDQARRIGDALRERDIREARVYSSQWCRCRETAELLGLGFVTDLPALNSFFRDRSTAAEQTEATRKFLAARPDGLPVILVTHQVNITALTQVFPASGEMVIVSVGQDGEVIVLDRITP